MSQSMPSNMVPVVRSLSRRTPARPTLVHAVNQPMVQERLGAALAEVDTILVLVFGTGPESDADEARCRALAQDPCFEDVRVLRIQDWRTLTRDQRARWLAGGGRLTVLGADRARAVALARPDAVELFVAMSVVAAA